VIKNPRDTHNVFNHICGVFQFFKARDKNNFEIKTPDKQS